MQRLQKQNGEEVARGRWCFCVPQVNCRPFPPSLAFPPYSSWHSDQSHSSLQSSRWNGTIIMGIEWLWPRNRGRSYHNNTLSNLIKEPFAASSFSSSSSAAPGCNLTPLIKTYRYALQFEVGYERGRRRCVSVFRLHRNEWLIKVAPFCFEKKVTLAIFCCILWFNKWCCNFAARRIISACQNSCVSCVTDSFFSVFKWRSD